MDPRNPIPTVDVIVEFDRGEILFIKRKNPPFGWALPGGFVDAGESLATAARREALEETQLPVELLEQFFTYSDPSRDPRLHTVSTVFTARAPVGAVPVAADDAVDIVVASPLTPPQPLAFDHAQIVADYLHYKATGQRPRP